ncbi:MAG: hypothetical protein IPK82_14180 [Polyangiaceae bacterium]|nr:hypothetical protein [Polyangiaceae bacterium]
MKRIKPVSTLLFGLLLTGCQVQEPFDPVAECPKIAVCGQCASRGACVWCGNPSDGSQGECVAVGRRDCAAPLALSKTPDQCAPPPNSTPAATPLVTSANPSPVEQRIGTERYQGIKKALTRAFPNANVTDEVIDLVDGVLRGPRPENKPADGPEKEPITRQVQEKEHPLYLAHAMHHRHKSMEPASKAMESKFTKTLPMVRVTLPSTLTAENTVIQTVVGDVDLSKDHLLGSIDMIFDKYGDASHLGFRPARVDLITAARSAGARFGAISVYLGYKTKTDKGPTFYMLEAGTATGDAKMIYFSKDMSAISNATSYYQPTPFVTMKNTYSGGVTMAASPREDEPLSLLVESRVPGEKEPYFTVLVSYTRSPTIDLPAPVELIINAAARVATVAQAMGVSSTEPLEGVLADLGKSFYWEETPRFTESAAPALTTSPTGQPPK